MRELTGLFYPPQRAKTFYTCLGCLDRHLVPHMHILSTPLCSCPEVQLSQSCLNLKQTIDNVVIILGTGDPPGSYPFDLTIL